MTPTELSHIKQKAIHWANQMEVCVLLDNNQCANAYGLNHIEFAMAAGVKAFCIGEHKDNFSALTEFKAKYAKQYSFGFFTYDLKNEIEDLQSKHFDGLAFPSLYFFIPEHLLLIDKDYNIHFESTTFSTFTEWLSNANNTPLLQNNTLQKAHLQARVNQKDYLNNVEKIKQHIIAGDVYELNYCMEFFDDNATIDPIEVYGKLLDKSPVPFAAYVKYKQQYLLCASPERFINKNQNYLYSQPIKGTIKRDLSNKANDVILKNSLLNSEKERAENLMIVDLVRNDLARVSKTGSVQVKELFGIYSFQQVHQMISTISSEIKDDTAPIDAIKHAFPMGSMTGAPKVIAMELIEQYELSKRGLYSGAVGYFTPEGNFDFNVVIRSIQYNANKHYLNIMVGGAITYDSIAAQEYEECLLKAQATMQVLQ